MACKANKVDSCGGIIWDCQGECKDGFSMPVGMCMWLGLNYEAFLKGWSSWKG